MSRTEVLEALIQTLTDVQSFSGRSVPDMNEDTCPIGDLDGFDSLNAIEASILLSDYLGCDIDSSLLLDMSGGKPPQLGRVADRICQSLEIHEKGKHK